MPATATLHGVVFNILKWMQPLIEYDPKPPFGAAEIITRQAF
jgi:hypothetical protein